MIGTEFLPGQGLGNRLFCYITARSVAADRGVPFGTAGRAFLGADFLDLDLGEEITDTGAYRSYHEADKRLFLPNSPHDMVHGCYVAGADPAVRNVPDGTLLYGNLQAEEYFLNHRADLKDWLRVRPEFESSEFTADDLCILNLRGGEYTSDPALYLRRRYWTDAMRHMREENPGMRFLIITDDPPAAGRILPGIPAVHGTPASDYVAVKNARYLILSNSSFAFFPAYTSETVRRIIAPKYWARHNCSDGYWSSPQNIYRDFTYMDRSGRLFSAEECLDELRSLTLPETRPYGASSPYTAFIRKRNELKTLGTKAVWKIQRRFAKKP